MAFAQALACQEAAFERAVDTHRFGGIVGTAGIETAILPEERAHSQLVGA
jgi:hypothetical protein